MVLFILRAVSRDKVITVIIYLFTVYNVHTYHTLYTMYVYIECAQRAADSIGCSATSDVPYVNKGVLYRCEVYICTIHISVLILYSIDLNLT